MQEIQLKGHNLEFVLSVKQWSDLMLELNLMKKAWHRYGVTIEVKTPGIKKILSWGTRKYDAKENRSDS